jgi:serine/threonine-protein kinase
MTEDLSRGSMLGKYELLLRIGRGGMATVWVALEHARNEEERRLVAVKAILSELASDPEFVKMFLDEGRLVQCIAHKNVVEVYEVGEAAGVMFMAMEWVEGDSLHALISEAGKRKPIPPEMAVRIVADAAAGLHAAHEVKNASGERLGVVHRDVSPHNILIGTDGQIKLVDFGVAKAIDRLSDVTSAGQLKGKFGYMSPEQAMARPTDRRSDVFALGIVLFELTTGRRLFRGEHDAETLHLVVSGEIPKPTKLESGYPPRLERIVLRALERDRAKRYQTAADFKNDLEAYLKGEHIVVPRAGIAALLKRVLGARIEQRRKAVRAALGVAATEGPESAGLISPEAAFAAPSSGEISAGGISAPGAQSASGVSAPSAPSSTPSGLSGRTTGPTTLSGAHPLRRSGVGGYLIGLVGLVVALSVVLVYALMTRQAATTTTTTLVAPAAQATQQPDEPLHPQAAAAATNDELATLSLDELQALDAGARAQRPRVRASAREPAKPQPSASAVAADAVAPVAAPEPEAPPPEEADPESLMRDNPYAF